MKKILNKLYQLKSLNKIETYHLFNLINNGQIDDIELAIILILMKIRGETTDEILGAIKSCTDFKKIFPTPNKYVFADITGTGGDKSNNINISTISAIIAAVCGYKIIKHCNYTITGKFGSSNFLERLGININISPQQAIKVLDEFNICFLLAPLYYAGFKNVNKVRKKLKTPTLFNILGPLLNPASPILTVIGVYKRSLMSSIAKVLKKLNYQRAILINSENTDEITLQGPSYVTEINNKKIINYQLVPKDFGLCLRSLNTSLNYSSEQKLNDSISLLKGKGSSIHRETIAANVAILIKLFGNEDLKKNTKNALDAIDSGEGYNLIKRLRNGKKL